MMLPGSNYCGNYSETLSLSIQAATTMHASQVLIPLALFFTDQSFIFWVYCYKLR